MHFSRFKFSTKTIDILTFRHNVGPILVIPYVPQIT